MNKMNVYKGRDSMRDYYNPDEQPPLPLVELPDALNPFRGDGVRIYAKMMTALPAQNIKALPALNMLQEGGSSALKTIVEPSSGSTVTSLAIISRVLHNNTDVHAYVSNKTEHPRLRLLQFFGLKVSLYGGPAQLEISDPRGQIEKLKKMAEDNENIWNPGQYENIYNPEAHIRWTGPQLMKQLPEINIFCAGMGSAGCITGTGTFLKRIKPSVTIIGVCNKVADAIPGPRPFPLFASIAFPWKKVTDAVKEISSIESYRLSMAMSREGLICGPSSGMALKGLFEFLQEQKDLGQLPDYAEPSTGEISCVIPCCDLPYQYMDTYFKKLGEDDFHTVSNFNLSQIDQGPYDSTWELSASEATKLHQSAFMLCRSSAASHTCEAAGGLTVLDLRRSFDFAPLHVSGSVNSPITSLDEATPSPFNDIRVLEAQYHDLEALINDACLGDRLHRFSRVLVLCYSGETAMLATSMLRQRGIETYSVRGGFQGIAKKCVGSGAEK